MTELRERLTLLCRPEQADAGIAAFFAAREDAEGVTRVRLRVPMIGTPVALEREVRVEARKTRDAENLNDIVQIAWQAEEAVVFPRFEGSLVTYGTDEGGGTFLELRGYYQPPLGAAGQVFDEAIGYQIARATACEFLADIKRDVEARVAYKRPG